MKKTKKSRVEKPYCNGTLSKSGLMSLIRSALRRLSLRWKPRGEYLKEVRRAYTGSDKRTKWEYPCVHCKKWFKSTHIEVDHIIPAGSIKDFDDIGPFVKRLLIEKEGYQTLCKTCHRTKTNETTN